MRKSIISAISLCHWRPHRANLGSVGEYFAGANSMLAGIAQTAPGEAGKVCEPWSSALDFLALAVLVSLLAGELAETPPPFAMNNETQLSTAVVTAPHDTFPRRRSMVTRAFSRPK